MQQQAGEHLSELLGTEIPFLANLRQVNEQHILLQLREVDQELAKGGLTKFEKNTLLTQKGKLMEALGHSQMIPTKVWEVGLEGIGIAGSVGKVGQGVKQGFKLLHQGKKLTQRTRLIKGLDLSTPAKAKPPTQHIHRFPQLTRSYFRDMEQRSGLKIPGKQRTQLKQALQKEKFEKLSQNEYATHNKTYNKPSTKKQIISDWEKNTGQKWPVYTANWYNTEGKLIYKKGDSYQIHHIIHQSHEGPHQWWNAHPMPRPGHQGGVHGKQAPGQILHNK